jgi:hypothetical protein
VFEKSDLERVVEEMYLSLFVFLKKNLMREGQLLFVIRRRRRRGEEEGAKNDVMESQSTEENRGKILV